MVEGGNVGPIAESGGYQGKQGWKGCKKEEGVIRGWGGAEQGVSSNLQGEMLVSEVNPCAQHQLPVDSCAATTPLLPGTQADQVEIYT